MTLSLSIEAGNPFVRHKKTGQECVVMEATYLPGHGYISMTVRTIPDKPDGNVVTVQIDEDDFDQWEPCKANAKACF